MDRQYMNAGMGDEAMSVGVELAGLVCHSACPKLVTGNCGNVWKAVLYGGDESVTAGKKKPLKRLVYRGLGVIRGAQKMKRTRNKINKLRNY
jgi:hypothetical protein